jgi:hypothetical protein
MPPHKKRNATKPPVAPKPLTDQLKAAIAASDESLYAIAKRAHVGYAILHRFANDQGDIRLSIADKLAAHLGLELTRRGKTRK